MCCHLHQAGFADRRSAAGRCFFQRVVRVNRGRQLRCLRKPVPAGEAQPGRRESQRCDLRPRRQRGTVPAERFDNSQVLQPIEPVEPRIAMPLGFMLATRRGICCLGFVSVADRSTRLARLRFLYDALQFTPPFARPLRYTRSTEALTVRRSPITFKLNVASPLLL